MRIDRGRLATVWRRVLGLSWPVMVEQVSRTLMRTTDIFVTTLFSPIAVAAIGLADLYARFPLRIGLGGTYLAITFATSPARHVALIGARSLQGTGDTRTPFLARTTGLLGFYLGFSAVTSVVLGWGVVGVYGGIVFYYAWSFVVVAIDFQYGGWAGRAAAMMNERGSVAGNDWCRDDAVSPAATRRARLIPGPV